MTEERDDVPVTTRVTRSMLVRVDELAREFGLTRGHALTLLLALAVNHDEQLLATYRALIASARERAARSAGGGAP